MDDITAIEGADPRAEIVRLETRIEQLAARIESCRKFILASRIAVSLGGILLASLIVGAIRFDLRILLASIAAVLGGFVLWGSNSSTEKEAADQMAAAEMKRAELIGRMELRLVEENPTLH